MTFIEGGSQPVHELAPGFTGKFASTETGNLGVIRWEIRAGSQLPAHKHPEEQIANVVQGDFELTVGEETKLLHGGDTALIPSNVLHGGVAHTDCLVIDVFTPARQIKQ